MHVGQQCGVGRGGVHVGQQGGVGRRGMHVVQQCGVGRGGTHVGQQCGVGWGGTHVGQQGGVGWGGMLHEQRPLVAFLQWWGRGEVDETRCQVGLRLMKPGVRLGSGCITGFVQAACPGSLVMGRQG